MEQQHNLRYINNYIKISSKHCQNLQDPLGLRKQASNSGYLIAPIIGHFLSDAKAIQKSIEKKRSEPPNHGNKKYLKNLKYFISLTYHILLHQKIIIHHTSTLDAKNTHVGAINTGSILFREYLKCHNKIICCFTHVERLMY